MSDQTKQNVSLAETLNGNPERLKSFLHRFCFANPLPHTEEFLLLSEAIRRKRTEFVKVVSEKIVEFDTKSQNKKKTIDKSGDFNNVCSSEDSFVDAKTKADLLELTILSGDLKLLEMPVDKGCSLNSFFGNHLLHIAVENNALEFVELLLNQGADINVRNSEDMTPLHVATMKGFFAVAEKLLDKGANINSSIYDLKRHNRKICDNSGNTSIQTIERLLKTGIITEEIISALQVSGEDNVDFYEKTKTREDYEGSSIFFAVQNVDVAMTKLLLSRGADIAHNPNLLNAAVNSGNLDIIECFTKRDIDINGKGEEEDTALHRAVLVPYSENLKVKIIKLLLRRGASVHSRNKSGQIPLHLAAQKGYAKLVETLLQYNPAEHDLPNSEDTLSEFLISEESGFSSKTKGTQFDDKNKIDVTQVRLAAQKDEDNSTNSEDSSVGCSILQGSEFGFVNQIAQLYAMNSIGETALHMASSMNHPEVVEILLKHGMDINCRTIFGKTALDVACGNGCRKAFVVLLKYGSEIDDVYTANILDWSRPNFCLIKSRRGVFIASDKNCTESIKKHIIRTKIAGRFVSKANLQCVANRDESLQSYHQECDEEIRKLKNEKVGGNVSFYDILRKNGNHLAVYARNERILQALESKDLKERFPIYSDMICYNLKKGQMRELLMNISLNSFNSSIEYYLPTEVVVTDIFRYLRNEDLVNFIEACHTLRI